MESAATEPLSNSEATAERPSKKRKQEHLATDDEELRRRGIVYISRMPPNMKPRHLQELLGQWGVITRTYCAPESLEVLARRKKRGGNKRRQFTEAWVEFESKRKAYNVALALNGQKIGNRKKDQWYDDVWCMKFLKHFKWYNLTEELKLKARVQEKMLQMQVAKAKHEANIYLENREKAIISSKIQENKQLKERKKGNENNETSSITQSTITATTTSEGIERKTPSGERDVALDDNFLFRLVGQDKSNKEEKVDNASTKKQQSNIKGRENKKRKRQTLN